MPTIRVSPERLPLVMGAAEHIARLLNSNNVDLNEAKKAVQSNFSRYPHRAAFEQYISHMAQNPPPRSRRTQAYFQALLTIWRQIGRNMDDDETAFAWNWAIRLALAYRAEQRAQERAQESRPHPSGRHQQGRQLRGSQPPPRRIGS